MDPDNHAKVASSEFRLAKGITRGLFGAALDFSCAGMFIPNLLTHSGLGFSSLDQWNPHSLRSGLPSELSSRRFNLISSVARTHHLAIDTEHLCQPLVQDLSSAAQLGCILFIQDVPGIARARNATDKWLRQHAVSTNEFFVDVVDQYSLPGHRGDNWKEGDVGHRGIYIELDAIARQFLRLGWTVLDNRLFDCCWSFDSDAAAYSHVVDLFELNPSKEAYWGSRLHRLIRRESCTSYFSWAMDSLILIKSSE